MIEPILVRNVMTIGILTLQQDFEIIKAMRALLEHDVSGAPVMNNTGDMVGILSQRDCLRALLNAHYHQVWGGQVKQYMVHPVVTMGPDLDLVSAASIFIESRYRRFPVIQDGKLLGQISRKDIMEALCKEWR